jgi:hypothetical protein
VWSLWRILTLAALGLLVLWTSPLLLHTVEFMFLKRVRGMRGAAAAPRAGPVGRDEERPA